MKSEMLKMRDGAQIHTVWYEPEGCASGVVQFVHGFGEHAGRYAELAGRFVARGMAFVMHDQRGHGNTPGARGVAPYYDSLLNDIDDIRDEIEKRLPGVPVFLYGHSMGGNISLNYLLSRSQNRHARAVIGSPWLRLHKPYPGVVMAAAGLMGKLSMSASTTTKLALEFLTHDQEIVGITAKDAAYHGTLSFRLFSDITRRGEYAIANARVIKLPTLLLCAGQDKIVSVDAIEQFAAAADSAALTLRRYPEQYHELHNELNRGDVFEDVWSFVTKNA